MSARHASSPISAVTWAATGVALLLVLLPAAGMWLSYLQPTGLFALPPMRPERLVPLVGRSLLLALAVSAIALTAGTWLAWVEQRTTFRGRELATALAILPLATPSYLIAAIAREEMAPAGRLGWWLGRETPFTGILPAILVLSCVCTPYVHVLVSAALRRCPTHEEQAARALGASPKRVFQTVILPRLRPTWSFALVLVSLYVVSDFGAVAILDCEVLTWELYKARGSRDAVVLGAGLMLVVIPLLAMTRLLHGRVRSERPHAHRAPSRHPLRGTQLAITWLILSWTIGLGLALPVVALLQWVWMGWRSPVVQFGPIIAPAWTTLFYTAVGALLVVLLALAPAWIAARRGRTVGGWIENAVYATSSVPGVLVAVGMLQLLLGLQRTLPGLQTLWLGLESAGVFLLLGYGMRFMSQAYAALKPAVLRLDPSQEDAARLLGATPWRRFQTITAPTLRPGFFAAYSLLFMSIAKELPITLTLIPIGETTLSYRIFQAQDEAALHNVGASGMVLLCFAVLLQISIHRWERHASTARRQA